MLVCCLIEEGGLAHRLWKLVLEENHRWIQLYRGTSASYLTLSFNFSNTGTNIHAGRNRIRADSGAEIDQCMTKAFSIYSPLCICLFYFKLSLSHTI